MDARTGRIYTSEEVEKMNQQFRDGFATKETKTTLANLIQMANFPTEKQMQRKPPKVGRNESCLCDSGKKFKHCCLKQV